MGESGSASTDHNHQLKALDTFHWEIRSRYWALVVPFELHHLAVPLRQVASVIWAIKGADDGEMMMMKRYGGGSGQLENGEDDD